MRISRSLTFSAIAIVAAPSALQAKTFDGPYIGVQSGWSRAEISDEIDNIPIDQEASQDALLLGAYVGYNYKATDDIVIGVEGSFNGAFDDDANTLSLGDQLEIDPRYSFDLSARAGYLINQRTLGYIRGGYANTRVRNTLVISGAEFRSSENLDGWQIGGGVEREFTPKISGRLEYRYSDYGNNGGDFDQHQVLVGVAYNF